MLLAWDNLADGATLSADTEVSTMPASNVQEPHIARKYRSTPDAYTAALTFDLLESEACSVLAVLGTNFDDLTRYRLRASDADPTAVAGDLLDTGTVTDEVIAGYGAIYHVFAAVTARYWLLNLDLTTSYKPRPGSGLYVEVGRIFLGPSWQPSIDMQLGCAIAVEDSSVVSQSYGGQDWIDQRPQQRLMQFELDYMAETEMTENAFAMTRAAGTSVDVLAMKYTTGDYISQNAVWGRLQASAPLVNDKVGLFRQKFTVRERL